MPPRRQYWCFIPLLLVLGFGLYHSWRRPSTDFAGYYYGGHALLHGNYHEAYDMVALNDRIEAAGYRAFPASYTPFPPFTSLVFAPFLIFPMDIAAVIFNSFSIVLFLFTLLRMTRWLSTPPYLILALPVIFFIPLLNNFANGQAYLLLFTLLGEGYLAYQKQRRILTAFLWAAAILFKIFPAFLFIFLLLKRRYRDTLYLGIACTLLLLPSLWINGISAWHFYLFTIAPRMNHGELNDSFTFIFQSAFMLLKRAFRYDQLLNPHPVADNPWLFTLGSAIFRSLILTAAVIRTRTGHALRNHSPLPTRVTASQPVHADKDDFIPFTIWITAAMLISPNGSSYSLILLILPLLGLAWRSRRDPMTQPSSSIPLTSAVLATPAPLPTSDVLPASDVLPTSDVLPASALVIAALTLTAACTIPVTRLGALPLLAQFPRLYLLLIFYPLLCRRQQDPGLALWPLRSWNLALFPALSVFFFALDIRGNLPEKDTGSYLLPKEEHLFITGFTARNNRLIYIWRDSRGLHEENTAFPVLSLTEDGLSIKDGQIWYKGKQLTHSPDQKAKPALINGSSIVYLSDLHRGFGFYTLRRLIPDAAPRDDAAAPGVSR